MIEIDMFFFFFGSETSAEGHTYNYLYRTKNLAIPPQGRYSQHHQTLYIDKAFDKITQLKKIVTFGIDFLLDE
jgi:hypothetical protein